MVVLCWFRRLHVRDWLERMLWWEWRVALDGGRLSIALWVLLAVFAGIGWCGCEGPNVALCKTTCVCRGLLARPIGTFGGAESKPSRRS